MPNIPGIENVNWFGGVTNVLASTVYWATIIFIIVAILAVVCAIYYWITFNYSMTIFPLYGSGKDGIFSFGKSKFNKIKWINKRTAWKPMFPLFNKREIEPFDSEYIYPGRKIIAFELNDELIPGRININKTEQEIRCEVNPVPYNIRGWQGLQHKKNMLEFAEHDFWTDNKTLIIGMICCMAMLTLCGFTIWFTYKYAMGGRADIQNLAQVIKNLNVVQKAAPG